MFNWFKSSKEEALTNDKHLAQALLSIIRVTNHASVQTKRLKWIRGRAKCALYGGNVRDLDYPTNRYKPSSRKRNRHPHAPCEVNN